MDKVIKEIIGEKSVCTRHRLADGIDIYVSTYWYAYKLRDLCIHEQWYTCGTNKEYEHLLNFVDTTPPTVENQYKVAQNILEHSDPNIENSLNNILFLMNLNNVVVQAFDIYKPLPISI